MGRDETQSLSEVAARSRYPIGAFHFVRRGLDYTVRQSHKDPQAVPEDQRHVSGRQLCEGLRVFAIEQYGWMAKTALERWRITRTEDFGHIVFAMVECGMMQATDRDSVRDFDGIFRFEEAFDVPIGLERVPPEGICHDLIPQD